MAILRPHLAFFWKLHDYLWQNWDLDGHFEVLYESESSLVQKLWHKTQKRKKHKVVFSNKITKKWEWKYLRFAAFEAITFEPIKIQTH